jgi:hypothetical protein
LVGYGVHSVRIMPFIGTEKQYICVFCGVTRVFARFWYSFCAVTLG